MGLTIIDLIVFADDLEPAGIWTRNPDKVTGALLPDAAYVGDSLESLLAVSDVLVDFSLPGGTAEVVPAAAAAGIPLVCGVSGLDESHLARIDDAASRIPLLYDRNMSRGVAVLRRLTFDAARALGPEFEVRIDETHHIHKKDAPSGTALKLGEAVADARGLEFEQVKHYAPGVPDHDAAPGQIHFHVERVDEVPGDHDVHFSNSSERLTLSHSVATRDVFARGALAAARWVVDQPAGLYSMQDVLFGDT